MSVDVLLSPNCETAAMLGSALVNGAQGEVTVIWEVDGEQYESGEVSDLPPGLCTVSVEDALGCEASTVVLVDAVGVPVVDLGEDQMGCVGEPISLLAPLGAGPTNGRPGIQVLCWWSRLRLRERLWSAWRSRTRPGARARMPSS